MTLAEATVTDNCSACYVISPFTSSEDAYGIEVVEVDFPFVLSASKGMAEQRIPNMRGIMAARTKPLNVIPPTDYNKLTSVVKFELPATKTGCKYLDPDSMDELVELLHNETKVI